MTDSPDFDTGKHSYPINLHVPGILRLLSEHLYSDPKVAIRELIQNAHDSCQRRLAEDSSVSSYTPRIDITLDPQNRLFIIQDNGSGLAEQEIHDYLATVGRGYTAELRDRLEFGSLDDALALIGQFGLGLLSAFIVARRVVLVTKSYQPGSLAWRWLSEGEETYILEPAKRSTPGSVFTLHLKLAGEFLLNEGVVRDAIHTYADFLEIPIYLNNEPELVNVIHAPWHRRSHVEQYREYIADRFHAYDPLTVIPLHDHIERVALPDGTVDEVVTPLSGVLFVPNSSVVSIREYGDVSLYVRRMFITDDERELLPRWAKFVRGVVDCPVLKPTVSREQVRRDDTFFLVQAAIQDQLVAHLQHLAKNDPGAWRNIVIAHNDLIKGWALQSPQFFKAICDLVTFETSRGRLTMQDYLQASGGDIYYFVEERGALQEKILYEARGLVVIDASRFAEEAFLQTYARTHPGVHLRQLEPGASFVFKDLGELDDAWTMINRYYNEQQIRTRIVRFEPVNIPAILVYPPGSDHIAEARAALDGGEISGALAGLVEEYLRMRDPLHTATEGILHLNADSPLMSHLLKIPPEHAAFTAALEIVYHNARFFAGRTLTAQEARQGFDMISYSVEQLVSVAEKAVNDSGDSLPPPTDQE